MAARAAVPSVDEYVAAALTALRARPREQTTFTAAGRQTIRSNGERVLYAPDGTPLRVVEDPLGGTQVEHGDHLHAVVRPRTVTIHIPRSTS